MIKAESIEKNINDLVVLKNVSVTIKKGKIVALLGPNGSGKTTLIRCILGLLSVDSGSINVDGCENNIPSSLKSKIGLVSDGNLYENLTVIENILLWRNIYNVDHLFFSSELNFLIDYFEIRKYLKYKVSELSKGTKQKVKLIRTFCIKPEILILDEPTTALDPEAIDKFNRYLKKINRERDVTVVFCTHILTGLDELADEMVVINNGRVIDYGEIKELKEKYNGIKNYVLYVDDIIKTQEFLTKKGIKTTSEDEHIACECSKYDMSTIIRDLSLLDVSIYEVREINNTISDLYFNILNERNNNDI